MKLIFLFYIENAQFIFNGHQTRRNDFLWTLPDVIISRSTQIDSVARGRRRALRTVKSSVKPPQHGNHHHVIFKMPLKHKEKKMVRPPSEERRIKNGENKREMGTVAWSVSNPSTPKTQNARQGRKKNASSTNTVNFKVRIPANDLHERTFRRLWESRFSIRLRMLT